jgi:hypothetical protein
MKAAVCNINDILVDILKHIGTLKSYRNISDDTIFYIIKITLNQFVIIYRVILSEW